jgi:hypothetical protein
MPAVRRTPALLAAGLAIASAVVAGCGGSGSPAHPKITLSITAPTNGAVVGVRQLQVAGQVAPANASVAIGGRTVPVRNGSFVLPVQLQQPTQIITVTARAQGYDPARTTTTVSFNSATAFAMQAARHAATSSRSSSQHLSSASGNVMPAFRWPGGLAAVATVSNPASSGASTSGTGSSGAGSSTGPSSSGSATSGSSPAGSSAGSGASGTGTPSSGGPPSGGSGISGSGGSSGGSSGSGSASTPTPQPWTPDRIHRLYVRLCMRGNGGSSVTSFCECTYGQMARGGRLQSRASLLAVERRLKRFGRTHKVSDLPRFVEKAVLRCVQHLPGNNVHAPLPITRFPSANHAATSPPTPSPPVAP